MPDSINMERIEEMFGQIQGNMQAMDSKISLFVEQMEKLKLENKSMKEQIIGQERKIEALEREARRRNLVFKGIDEDEKEEPKVTKEKVIKTVERLGIKIEPEADIDETRRLGRPIIGKTRPILLKLTTGDKKIEILKNSKALKGTNIWIDEDYTKETQQERQQLITPLKEARRKGHRAYLRHNKLVVNDEVYEMKNSELIRIDDNKMQKDKNKRTVSERSPNGKSFEDQISKLSKTAKN